MQSYVQLIVQTAETRSNCVRAIVSCNDLASNASIRHKMASSCTAEKIPSISAVYCAELLVRIAHTHTHTYTAPHTQHSAHMESIKWSVVERAHLQHFKVKRHFFYQWLNTFLMCLFK